MLANFEVIAEIKYQCPSNNFTVARLISISKLNYLFFGFGPINLMKVSPNIGELERVYSYLLSHNYYNRLLSAVST